MTDFNYSKFADSLDHVRAKFHEHDEVTITMFMILNACEHFLHAHYPEDKEADLKKIIENAYGWIRNDTANWRK